MSVKKPVLLMVGVATGWVLAYPALFLIVWLVSLRMMFLETESPLAVGPLFSYFIPLHLLTFVLQLGLLAFYLIRLIRNQVVSEAVKIGFALLVVLIPYVGMPAYFIIFMWRARPPHWALSHSVKIDEPPTGQPTTEPRGRAMGSWLALAMLVAIPLCALVAVAIVGASIAPQVIGTMQQGFLEPKPPKYASLSRFPDNRPLPHEPAISPEFDVLSSYSDVSAWRYSKESPIIVGDGFLIIAGYFHGTPGSRVSVDLVKVDLPTGQVIWQALSGDNYLAADADRVYHTSAPEPFGAVSVVATSLQSGAPLWQTPLEYQDAIGIEYIALVDNALAVRTYHRGKGAFYNIDKSTGAIIDKTTEPDSIVAMSRGLVIEWYGDSVVARGEGGWTTRIPTDRSVYDFELGAPVILDGAIIVASGYLAHASVSALDRRDGRLLWRYDGISASNIAVDRGRVIFLDDTGTLIVLDQLTGNRIASLQFTPGLASNYDFANDSLLVAAGGNLVAVYFEDAKQLTVLRYHP